MCRGDEHTSRNWRGDDGRALCPISWLQSWKRGFQAVQKDERQKTWDNKREKERQESEERWQKTLCKNTRNKP